MAKKGFFQKLFGIESPLETAEREAYEKEALYQAKEKGKRQAKKDYKDDRK